MRKVERACAFTGHRPRKFPWGYDELDARCVSLKSALTEQIEQLARNGVTQFLSGMAEGVDTWAALAVLALRGKNDALKLERTSSGDVPLYFGAGGLGGLCQPGLQKRLYVGAQPFLGRAQ